MISSNTVKCNVCKNRTGNKGEWGMSCKAYPEGIPLEIISSLKIRATTDVTIQSIALKLISLMKCEQGSLVGGRRNKF